MATRFGINTTLPAFRAGDTVYTQLPVRGCGGCIPAGVQCQVEQATRVATEWEYCLNWEGRSVYCDGRAIVAVGFKRGTANA